MSYRHKTPRGTVNLKPYSHQVVWTLAQSTKKKMNTVLELGSDALKRYKLITPEGKFLFAEWETAFIVERENSIQGEGMKPVKIELDACEFYKAESKRSGIPVYHLTDHVSRVMRNTKYLSGDNRGVSRLEKAIKAIEIKSQVDKIHYVETRPLEESTPREVRQVLALKAVARNRVYPQRNLKPITIRLMLTVKNFKDSVSRALDNYYRWTDFNANEVKAFMEEIEENRNPVNLEVIKKNTLNSMTCDIIVNRYLYKYNSAFTHDKKQLAKDLYELLGIEWSYPPWMGELYQLLDFYKISKRYKKLREMHYTNKMWFDEFGIEVPDTYLGHEHEVVSTSKELKRTGIAEALDLKIKELLKIEDEFEYAVNHYDELDDWERNQIQSKVRWEFKDHEYAQLLREKFEAGRSSDHLG